MAPFSANIGFLMMECDEIPLKRVMTFLQERPVKLPKCDEVACDWENFKAIYAVITFFKDLIVKRKFENCFKF